MTEDTRPASERHWHWEFLAHDADREEPDPPVVSRGCVVVVIGYWSEADARIAAADIVQRKWYLLRRVTECPACGYQATISTAMQEIAAGAK